jgi:glycosyltransferase involved in cell wall biosynthesis
MERGMEYVLNQDYKNLEILLVDDGSTDESGAICNAYAEKDSRIKVFHKPNGGAGDARNYGLDHATGDYIYFFDVDDEFAPNLISFNIKVMEEYQTDLNIFNFKYKLIEEKTEDVSKWNELLISSNEELKNNYVYLFINTEYGNGYLWNKFYRRSFIEKYHIRFTDTIPQQDEIFNIEVCRYAERVFVSHKILYTYNNDFNSVRHYLPNRYGMTLNVYNSFLDLFDYWNLKDISIDNYMDNYLFYSIYTCIFFNMFLPTRDRHKYGSRASEINSILNNQLTVELLKRYTPTNDRDRRYHFVYKKKSIFLIYLIHYGSVIKKKLMEL